MCWKMPLMEAFEREVSATARTSARLHCIEPASDRILRPEEVPFPSLVKTIGKATPIENSKSGWKARMIAKKLARLRADQADQVDNQFATRMPSIHLQGKFRDRIRRERRVTVIPLITRELSTFYLLVEMFTQPVGIH